MVRHHVSKSKKNAASKKQKELKMKAELLKDLDRFAGSSEEEKGGSEMDTDDESLVPTNEDDLLVERKPRKESTGRHVPTGPDLVDGDEADASSNENNDDSSSDEDEYGVSSLNSTLVRVNDSDKNGEGPLPKKNSSESNGMAGAMAKILGLSEPKSSSVILSKTTTPLQKLQKKEKAEAAALQSKRRDRREVNLTAMHVPLSAATSKSLVKKKNSNEKNGLRLAKEIEIESMHRRVATRGVVALFNTIAKHQQEKAQQVRYYCEKKFDSLNYI